MSQPNRKGRVILAIVGGAIPARFLETADVGMDMALGLLIGDIGLVVGQFPRIVLSGANQDDASETSGLQGTAQNLGVALGAMISEVMRIPAFARVSSRWRTSAHQVSHE